MEINKTIGKYRWTICSLLFFATTINYIDRSVMGMLKGTLQKEIGWTEAECGYIIATFTAAYTFGALFFGRNRGKSAGSAEVTSGRADSF